MLSVPLHPWFIKQQVNTLIIFVWYSSPNHLECLHRSGGCDVTHCQSVLARSLGSNNDRIIK